MFHLLLKVVFLCIKNECECAEGRKGRLNECVVMEGAKTTVANLPEFLSVNLATCIAERHIGPHLLKHGILRQHLLGPGLMQACNAPAELTNGMVVDVL